MSTTNVQLRVALSNLGGISVTVDHLRGTAAELAASNPTPGYGVFVVETDADRGKFGDGVTAYNDLPYFAGYASWSSISGKPSTFTPSAHTHAISDVTGLQTALDGKQAAGSYAAATHTHAIADVTGLQTALDGKQVAGSYAAASHNHTASQITDFAAAVVSEVTAASFVQTSDSRLSDSREWSASTVTQAQAEAGTDTSRLAWTVQRVWQAIAAWWAASSAKTKLDGIATGATANQTDAYLLDRGNHTGTQTASTISDFNTAVAAAAPSYTLPIASASTLGGIKIGSGLSINGSGVVTVTGGGGGGGYTITSGTALPTGGVDGDIYLQYV